MRLAKMFGLAAIAAVAAMAFIGASPASALSTQLCSQLSVNTGCGTPTTSVHWVSTEAAKILNPTLILECSVLFASTSVGALGTPAQTIKGHFTYTGCKSALGSCSAQEVSSEAILAVEKTGTEEAKMTGSWEVLAFCSGFIHCVFTSTGVVATIKGSDSASAKAGHISIVDQVLGHLSGALCPASAKLDLLMQPLSAFYIRE
jgi:hypothetical protein